MLHLISPCTDLMNTGKSFDTASCSNERFGSSEPSTVSTSRSVSLNLSGTRPGLRAEKVTFYLMPFTYSLVPIRRHGSITLSPQYKGPYNSAYLVLTLISAQILTSFDP